MASQEIQGGGAERKKECLVRTIRACANLIAENTREQKEMTLVDVKLHGRGLMLHSSAAQAQGLSRQ